MARKPAPKPIIKRTRRRPEADTLTKEERSKIAQRVVKFWDDDDTARAPEKDAKLQRYAKFRQWTAARAMDDPWSDAALPDMMADSLKLQDTLHNAVMSTRPIINSKGLNPEAAKKQKNVDLLLDFQAFIEQPGEAKMGKRVQNFVNDGFYTVLIPWIEEKQEIQEARLFPALPKEMFPSQYFQALISKVFPGAQATMAGKEEYEAWDWTVQTDKSEFGVKFYTRKDGRIEMVTKTVAETFNGPCPIVIDWDDIAHPAKAENLQRPSASNPKGAAHVTIRFPVTIDEIKRHRKSGYYDLLSDDDMKTLESATEAPLSDSKAQKATIQGVNADQTVGSEPALRPQRSLTMLMCFDMYDVDGDDLAEDMIFWTIYESKLLVKAKRLTEMYPVNPPRRPLVRAEFIEDGIGLLEMMEPTHDTIKALTDQTMDNGTIATTPFFFYRASGGMRPETIRLMPGEGYPVADPSRDVNFPNIRTDSVAFGINMITLMQQGKDRLSMQNDLSFGGVPKGKSAALRTQGNMAMVMAQGEARPERILRRLFNGLAEEFCQMHELNEKFLPPEKMVRIMQAEDADDVFLKLKGPDDISGRFTFGFGANVFNTSRQALQEALGQIMPVYISGIAVQSGIVTADGIYRLFRDWAKAWGQDPTQYLTAPSPDADKERIYAEEAIAAIHRGVAPGGVPAEAGGAQEHLMKLLAFYQGDEFGHLAGESVQLFAAYVIEVQERMKREMQQAQMIAAANQFGKGGGGDQGGRPPVNPPQGAGGPTMISGGNEMLDEALPTAGGGANG